MIEEAIHADASRRTPNTGTQDFTSAINASSPFGWVTYFPAWCTD